jgi:hypothetical protein
MIIPPAAKSPVIFFLHAKNMSAAEIHRDYARQFAAKM